MDTNCNALQGLVNVYFRGTETALSNSSQIDVSPRNVGDSLQGEDVILIIQMQQASFDSTDSPNYGGSNGSGTGYTSLGSTGRYEFNVVLFYEDGIIHLQTPLSYSYSHSDSPKSSFQVIKVPVCGSGNLVGSIFCAPWNGNTGGVIAIITNDLSLNSHSIDCSESGFRGGAAGLQVVPLPNVENFASSNSLIGGRKGEGICGAPSVVSDFDSYSSPTGETYQGGEYARGAPCNAGGGGNQHNGAGGGGGLGGKGGIGGNTQLSSGSLGLGGIGGVAIPETGLNDGRRIIMGGGGGAGQMNDFSNCFGGVGGGIIFIRFFSISGPGSILSNGQQGGAGGALFGDGSGGGGAGGLIFLFSEVQTIWDNLKPIVRAEGGDSGPSFISHPSGGGGGGGIILLHGIDSTDDTLFSVSPGLASNVILGGPYSKGMDGESGLILTVPAVFQLNCASPSSSQTQTRSNSASITVSRTSTRTTTRSQTSSVSISNSRTLTTTPTKSQTLSRTASVSATTTPSSSPSRTSSKSISETRTKSLTASFTSTPTASSAESATKSTSPSSQPPSSTKTISTSRTPTKTSTKTQISSISQSTSTSISESFAPSELLGPTMLTILHQSSSPVPIILSSAIRTPDRLNTPTRSRSGNQIIIGNGVTIDLPDNFPPISVVVVPAEDLPTLQRALIGSEVIDVSFINPYNEAFKVEICFTPQNSKMSERGCLGFLDETKSPPKWVCEDKCLESNNKGQLCGTTSHFTNFALLLQGEAEGNRSDCESDSWDWITGQGWSDYLLIVLCLSCCCLTVLFLVFITHFQPMRKLIQSEEGRRVSQLREKHMQSIREQRSLEMKTLDS